VALPHAYLPLILWRATQLRYVKALLTYRTVYVMTIFIETILISYETALAGIHPEAVRKGYRMWALR